MELFKNFQSDDLKDKHIRATPEVPKRVSVYDAIIVMTGNKKARDVWYSLCEVHSDVAALAGNFKFPGQGQRDTPVVGAKGLVTIMNLLQGERAAKFRAAEADVLVRYLGGDLSLIQEVQGIRQAQQQLPQDHPARIFGEQVEAVKQLGDLTETKEHLGIMLDRAEKLVAIKPDLQETSGLLNEFPFEKFGTFLKMRCQEMTIRQQEVGLKRDEVALKREECDLEDRQLGTKRKRFELTQQEDEHGLRMKREGAELDDRSAKRRRFDKETDDGITISAILAELAKSAGNGQAFIKKAEELGVRLRAFNEFTESLIPGTRSPRRYRSDAAQQIGEAIKKWVAAAQPAANSGIKKYFAQQQQAAAPVADADLYD